MVMNSELESLCSSAGHGRAVPLRREVSGSDPDPVSVFQRMRANGASFILEEADPGGRIKRSVLGSHPLLVATFYPNQVEVRTPDDWRTTLRCSHPLEGLRQLFSTFRPGCKPGSPTALPFLMGYFHYEVVRHWEHVAGMVPGSPDGVEGRFFVPGRLVEYDHVSGRVWATVPAPAGKVPLSPKGYGSGMEHLDHMVRLLTAGRPTQAMPTAFHVEDLKTDFPRDRFESAVDSARSLIRDGEAIQVVLSRRLTGRVAGDDLVFYRNLRALNPSPYLFYVSFGETRLAGASPEMLVRLKGRSITYKPIAGTRPRGRTPQEDSALENELRQDPKERAEHVMLVDLGRNDVGRVAVPGSVRVTELMEVDRYSHVMHLVSRIEAQLDKDKDGLDLLMSVFPAGTVTGAPKIRAMEIIARLEPGPRGPYAGAVGFIGGNGDMDFCIPIRTAFMEGERFTIQAGAGIVHDSIPEREFQETEHKARALIRALERSKAA